jgi:hypothetical protein
MSLSVAEKRHCPFLSFLSFSSFLSYGLSLNSRPSLSLSNSSPFSPPTLSLGSGWARMENNLSLSRFGLGRAPHSFSFFLSQPVSFFSLLSFSSFSSLSPSRSLSNPHSSLPLLFSGSHRCREQLAPCFIATLLLLGSNPCEAAAVIQSVDPH